MRILNVGLMCNSENGFTAAMRRIAPQGYMHMACYHGSFNQDLLREAEIFKPDLIFLQIQQENVISEDTVCKLAQNSFVMNFSGDVRENLPDWYVHIGKHIHLSTFTNMVDVNRIKNYGIPADYLEIGFDPEIYKKRPEISPVGPSIVAHFNNYEPSFPLSPYRIEIVNRLKVEFGDDFGIYGNFPEANGNFNSDQIEEAKNYSRAKIAINCSHFNFERYSSDRMLRILGSGAMCLSHYFLGIEADYRIGHHLDTFNDLGELTEKCKHYLKNEEHRNVIATAGHHHAHNNFTFDNMAKNILELYNRYKK